MQSLSEQLSAADFDKTLLEQQRKLQRWITIIAGSTISIVVGGVMWGIIYEIMIVKGEVLVGSAFLAFLIGLVLFALLNIYKESLVKTSGKRRTTQPRLTQEGEDAKLLPETYFEPISSATEHTTELLMVEEKESKE